MRPLSVASAVSAILSTAVVFAQDSTSTSSSSELQTVTVTGSRIARPELEATAPMLNLSSADLAVQGYENLADIATQLPQFAPAFGLSRTQSTFAGANDSGLNQINLRNLGTVRTIVLINGRRVPGANSVTTGADMNILPTANIERVEVLTGGAAAVYGADAVAGVVNIITKKNFTGVEIGASYGASSEGDNENPSGYLMLGGTIGESGHGLLTIQYDEQGRVSCADRFLCEQDFAWLTPATPVRGPAAYSGVNLNGRFFTPSGASYTRRTTTFTDLTPFSITQDGYNRNGDRDLAIPTERIMVAAEADVEISSHVSGFTEINFGQSEAESVFEGHPFQSSAAGSLFGGGPGIAGLQASIPLSNPFVPTAFRNAFIAELPAGADLSTQQINWQQRFNFGGFRGASNNRQAVRAVAGLRGDIESLFGFGESWQWEVSHVYGRTSYDGLTEGLVGTDRLYYGLRVEADPSNPGQFRCADAGARAIGCIPVNPFAEYTSAMIDYLSIDAGQHGRSTLQNTVAYITGSLLNLPAGPLQTAVGVERRRFTGFLDYDEAINNALVTGNQIGDTDEATISAKEAFVEFLVPVIKEKRFVEALSVETAFRRSDTNLGDYDTWKFGGNWQPIEGLRLRAMQSRSVRAPVPDDLSGIGQTFGVVNDPCTESRRNDNSTRAANCLADGVPAGYEPLLSTQQSVAGLTGGNPNLTTEEGNSTTFGFVLSPTFLPNFTFSLDRFKIDVDGIITTLARQTAVNLCYDTADRQFCDVVTRGSTPPEGNKTYVLRAVNEQMQNIAEQNISGFDVEARYGFDVATPFKSSQDLGSIKLQLLMTFYDKAEFVPLPGQPALDFLGAAGGSTTDQGFLKRQGTLNVGYKRGPIAANWHTRYIGRAKMAPVSFLEGYPEIGSHAYHDLRLGFEFRETSEIYAGVNNVFDKEPPFFASGASGTQALDTIPGYYDIFGRSYFGGVRVKF